MAAQLRQEVVRLRLYWAGMLLCSETLSLLIERGMTWNQALDGRVQRKDDILL